MSHLSEGGEERALTAWNELRFARFVDMSACLVLRSLTNVAKHRRKFLATTMSMALSLKLRSQTRLMLHAIGIPANPAQSTLTSSKW